MKSRVWIVVIWPFIVWYDCVQWTDGAWSLTYIERRNYHNYCYARTERNAFGFVNSIQSAWVHESIKVKSDSINSIQFKFPIKIRMCVLSSIDVWLMSPYKPIVIFLCSISWEREFSAMENYWSRIFWSKENHCQNTEFHCRMRNFNKKESRENFDFLKCRIARSPKSSWKRKRVP